MLNEPIRLPTACEYPVSNDCHVDTDRVQQAVLDGQRELLRCASVSVDSFFCVGHIIDRSHTHADSNRAPVLPEVVRAK
jgi:hypothetical protein